MTTGTKRRSRLDQNLLQRAIDRPDDLTDTQAFYVALNLLGELAQDVCKRIEPTLRELDSYDKREQALTEREAWLKARIKEYEGVEQREQEVAFQKADIARREKELGSQRRKLRELEAIIDEGPIEEGELE